RLADDVACHAASQILMHFRLDRVDNLELVPAFEWLKVAVEPLPDYRIARLLEQLPAEARPLQHGRYVENRGLRAAPGARVFGAERFVGFEQCKRREPKGILHARTPVPIEFPSENSKRVCCGLITVPAEANVQQVYGERAPSV